jgi:D-glycero-alpha-D-manno-heptose-7-phosphate kinase
VIITKTPYRISFFGGGTDYPSWYLEHGGAVLSTTIDKYCYVSCRYLPPFFNIKHRIVWSHIETVSTLAEILHPAVREGLRWMGFDDTVGLEIQHQGDLPARSGMGSSSSFAVGLIKCLSALKGQMITKHDLAIQAIELEQRILGEPVGSQDQVAAAYGGFNIIQFSPSGDIRVQPLTVAPERLKELESNLMLFYTGTSRLAAQIGADVIGRMGERHTVLQRMREMVDEAIGMLNGKGSICELGSLLDESWSLKRKLSALISNTNIDKIYQRAINAGALGGKLLGAGASGFMLFFVPILKQEVVKAALSEFLYVPVQFEKEGCSVIHYDVDAQDRRCQVREVPHTVLPPAHTRYSRSAYLSRKVSV